MTVSIVIPNYNGEKLLKNNVPIVIGVLDSFAKKTKSTVELIISDDGSKDKSQQILEELKAKGSEGNVHFVIILNQVNKGFSTNVNRGVAKASGDVVVLLNSDVIPDEGFLQPLLLHFSDEKVFAVGCMDKSVEPDGTVVLRGRGVGKWQRGFLIHGRGELEKTDTLWVSGGSGAFRRETWNKLGGLTELMNPFYWEDIDLSYRALKAGYKIVFEKKSTVVHKHEEGAIKKTATPMRVKITSYRNQFFFIWLNITDFSLIISHVAWLPYHLFTTLISWDLAFWQGFIKAVLLLPEATRYRRRNNRFFTVSDKEIFKQCK